MSRLVLRGGTVITAHGVEARLDADTPVEVDSALFDALRPYSTTPLVEYPKVVGGVTFQNAEEEAAAHGKKPDESPSAEPPDADPLSEVELDGAAAGDEADDEPAESGSKKKKASKKK